MGGEGTTKDTEFVLEPNKVHYFLVALDASKINLNNAKTTVADYNQEFHKLDRLRVNNIYLGTNTNAPLLVIRRFKNATEAMDYYNGGHYTGALPKIKVPIRAIHSRYPFDVEAFQPYTKMIDGVNMPNVGHLPMLEKPDEFNRILGEMVEEIQAIASSSE